MSRQIYHKNVALIIGVTGLVGNSLSEILLKPETNGGPWKVYGVARRPRPRWNSDCRIEYIQCDVSDAETTRRKLSCLTDVTHVFYVTWASRETEAECCDANAAMLRHVLTAVAPSLRHVVLQTGTKQYVGPYESLGRIRTHEPPFSEDLPRLPYPNFYYALEDVLCQELEKTDQSVSWSVHRPNVVFGFSPYSLANIVFSFCIYAAVCKHEGVPMYFPLSKTTWECYSVASDADLIAEQEIWAAMEASCKNEAFNCSNGDVFKWKQLWGILAESFGIEEYGFEEGKNLGLVEMMKDKGNAWREIVEKHGLEETELDDGIVGSWKIVDAVMAEGGLLDCMKGDGILDSMNKSKEFGFLSFRNSKKSFVHWISKYKDHKIVP
ncbi:PREDICTED: 3-oxo-Delta(4,5)-steroid 5-beta-reductase-like [Tarenaya hassleriana]|uniref:3-oxo-Delta(4,5)-steroid 5-beta-reductase-like n=1 Tax=Tarenaya hassleriana TaxID=28532 RepID=UPI00053C40D9|nr:PREDICTED: 3-oxo-Delta(4,5)-steroid 5-beta-reductase-like [Tarenaya hassleriana]